MVCSTDFVLNICTFVPFPCLTMHVRYLLPALFKLLAYLEKAAPDMLHIIRRRRIPVHFQLETTQLHVRASKGRSVNHRAHQHLSLIHI